MSITIPTNKTIFLPMILALFFVLSLTPTAHAENANSSKWDQRGMDRINHRPKEMMSFLKPLRKLSLSEEQREEIKLVLATHRENTEEKRNQLRQLKIELTELIPNFSDTNAQNLSLQLGKVMGELEYAKISVRALIYQTLTPDQRDELVAMTVFGKD